MRLGDSRSDIFLELWRAPEGTRREFVVARSQHEWMCVTRAELGTPHFARECRGEGLFEVQQDDHRRSRNLRLLHSADI
jgi:hypothetical protein